MPVIYENQTPRIKGVGLHYTTFAPSTGTGAAPARAWDAGKDFLTVELGLSYNPTEGGDGVGETKTLQEHPIEWRHRMPLSSIEGWQLVNFTKNAPGYGEDSFECSKWGLVKRPGSTSSFTGTVYIIAGNLTYVQNVIKHLHAQPTLP